MRTVSVTPTGGGQAVVIGDDALGRGVGCKLVLSLRTRFDAAVQRADFTRGAAPTLFDREQETADIVCDVVYIFASLNACDDFILGLQAAVPRHGTLTISTTGETGTQTRTLSGCWCRPVEVLDQIGVSATVRYQFSGGKITT